MFMFLLKVNLDQEDSWAFKGSFSIINGSDFEPHLNWVKKTREMYIILV